MDPWRPYLFHVRIADHLAFDAWPDVAPLLALLDDHQRYAVSLDALWRGAVQTPVVAEGADRDGSQCPRCGRLEAGRVDRCPACSSVMLPMHDLYHVAMERALEQAGSAEVVHGDAARRLLEAGDGLGAILRYR